MYVRRHLRSTNTGSSTSSSTSARASAIVLVLTTNADYKYVFPKEDDMDNDDLFNELGLLEGWHASQGIYIYRENRLIKWGDWCNLTKNGRDPWRREEKFKRCRVYLKYESELDSEFRPNVQKTKSIIAHYLRHQIAEYCEEMRNESSKVVRKKQNNEAILNDKNTEISLIQIKEGNNIFINHAHPLIRESLEKKSDLPTLYFLGYVS